jgi:hypothetical protein
MIAKNAGIRRAQGSFILATNIDILFSDELMRFIAACSLEKGKMYRVDRYDVMPDVPVDASLDEQLHYCRNHVLRLNTREGTFGVTADGLRALAPHDIAPPDSGLNFGVGWFPVENDAGRLYRWAENDAEIFVQPPDDPRHVLSLELRPGPGTNYGAFLLQVLDSGGAQVMEARIKEHCTVRLRLPLKPAVRNMFRFRVAGGGLPVTYDSRILNFQVFRCAWEKAVEPESRTVILRSRSWASVAARMARTLRQAWQGKQNLRREVGPVHLHTNACGDFTLLAREHWFDLRGYPEFDLFSMNIDSVFCWAAHHGGAREEILPDPMRIYHIEHGTGSGWTPEGQAQLFERIAAKGLSWLDIKQVLSWAGDMNRLNAPMIFNQENWGLSDDRLTEYTVA